MISLNRDLPLPENISLFFKSIRQKIGVSAYKTDICNSIFTLNRNNDILLFEIDRRNRILILACGYEKVHATKKKLKEKKRRFTLPEFDDYEDVMRIRREIYGSRLDMSDRDFYDFIMLATIHDFRVVVNNTVGREEAYRITTIRNHIVDEYRQHKEALEKERRERILYEQKMQRKQQEFEEIRRNEKEELHKQKKQQQNCENNTSGQERDSLKYNSRYTHQVSDKIRYFLDEFLSDIRKTDVIIKEDSLGEIFFHLSNGLIFTVRDAIVYVLVSNSSSSYQHDRLTSLAFQYNIQVITR